MKQAVKTQLSPSKAPLEWAVIGNGTLYPAQILIDAQGQVVPGGIEAQARQTLDNLKHTLEAAGLGGRGDPGADLRHRPQLPGHCQCGRRRVVQCALPESRRLRDCRPGA
jgi:hypothetical protein